MATCAGFGAFWVLLMVVVCSGGCASFSSFGSSGAGYRSWLESRVETRRLYDRGKQLFSAKLLAADGELKLRQEEVAPGFSFSQAEGRRQFVLAVTAFSRRELTPLDIFLRLDGREPVKIEEIRTSAVHERLYPYAYPFYRVFLVDFDAASGDRLELLTPYGRLDFDGLGRLSP